MYSLFTYFTYIINTQLWPILFIGLRSLLLNKFLSYLQLIFRSAQAVSLYTQLFLHSGRPRSRTVAIYFYIRAFLPHTLTNQSPARNRTFVISVQSTLLHAISRMHRGNKNCGKYRTRTDKQGSVSFKLAHIPIYQCPCFTIKLTSLKNEQFYDILRSTLTDVEQFTDVFRSDFRLFKPALRQRTP